MKGLVHIYEGTGKGKSTAGVGLTIRCAGNGFPAFLHIPIRETES